MRATAAVGLPNAKIRPVKHAGDQVRRQGFPVYEDLVGTLLGLPVPNAAAPMPDATARHLCAVLSTWAYSDPDTVAQMMVRMGLEQNQCRYKEISNNANFVRSSVYLVQSKCGRVVLLAYRGTDPFDVSTWAVSSDVNTVLVPVRGAGADARIHGGFYRNQRATWFDVVAALKQAARGRSILWDQADGRDEAARDAQLEDWDGNTRLFITGHSLGGAMALLAAYKLMTDPAYAQPGPEQPALRPLVHGVYTFGQPMVGTAAFALHCSAVLAGRLFCHTYRDDVVPHLPPEGLGTQFAHAGKHFDTEKRNGGPGGQPDPSGPQYQWRPAPHTPRPAASVLAIATAALGILTQYIDGRRIIDEGLRHFRFLRYASDRLQETDQHPEGLPAALAGYVSRGTGNVLGPALNALQHIVVKPIAHAVQKFAPQAQAEDADPSKTYSFAYHAPMNYLAASQPAGKLTEFGDDF